MSLERKSSRVRIPTEKAKDGFPEEVYTDLVSETEDRDDYDEDPGGDDDFVADHVDGSDSIGEEEMRERDLRVASDLSESEASKTPTPSEEDSEGGSEETRDRRQRPTAVHSPSFHSRGLVEIAHHVSRESHRMAYFGPDSAEVRRFDDARRRWFGDVVLPSKMENQDGLGGMAHFPSHTEETRQHEATSGWDWYYDDGGLEAFRERQRVQTLTPEEGTRYLPKDAEPPTVILGPLGQQRAFDIKPTRPASVSDLWTRCFTSQGDGDSTRTRGAKEDKGWVFNIGSSVRCLEWAPNHNHETQYLAIAASPIKSSEYSTDKPSGTPFEPGPSHSSSVQLWAFAPAPVHASNESALAAIESPPHLETVLAFEWGDVRTFKWCPMPRYFRPSKTQISIPLGLLAAVFSDGFARVFDVFIPHRQTPASPPTYLLFSNPVFAYRPPSSVCTSLTFLSATDLALAFANGSVAIFDICPRSLSSPLPSSGPNPPPTPLEPAPYFYQPLHSTYILSLTSGYPSFPHFLISSSLDGYIRLTDIRSPHIDTVTSVRQRFGPSLITYFEPLLSVLTADESDTLRILPLRRFFSTISVARCPASPTALALGHVHPIALVGCADGTVLATNPMRRFYGDSRTKTGRGRQVLRVCKHEYRPLSSSSSSSPSSSSSSSPVTHTTGTNAMSADSGSVDGRDDRARAKKGKGMVRFTEGYKPQKAEAAVKAPKGEEAVTFSTIYEEESAVRAVAWNPNLSCGGWAAMGFGSGLVRVMDLAR